jgi:hypothetical protein
MVWTLALPAAAAKVARADVRDVLVAGEASGVLIAQPGAIAAEGEPLPYEAALRAGRVAPFVSRVNVRDPQGAIVEHTTGDAGKLLRAVERFDPVEAQHFAASHPFAAAWTSSTLSSLTISIAFFTTLWVNTSDPMLHARNTARLEAFRKALTEIAQRRSGRLTAAIPAAAIAAG